MTGRRGSQHRAIRAGGVLLAGLIAALSLATAPGLPGPATVAAATGRGGPFGTPAIDGVAGAGEWDAAAAVPFRITMSPEAGGGSADATLFVMNDAKNVYAALRVGAVYDALTVRLLFDRDRDGWSEIGDDGLEVTFGRAATQPGPLALADRFYGRCGTGYCWLDDHQAGTGNPPAGTVDGRAAGAFDTASGYLELAHPIAGRDAAHDLHLALGAAVGFRLETSISVPRGYGGGGVPVEDCATRPCRSSSDLVIATSRARVSTPQEVVDAIRVEGLGVSPAAAVPGTTFRASFRVVNRSARTLVVPLDPSGTYLGGWLEEWLERLGPDPAIGARNTSGITRVGLQPIDVLAALGGTRWPPGVAITFPRDPPPNSGEIWTRGHPPGDYRYTVLRFPPPPGASSVQSSAARFTLKGVAAEWQAAVGTGGRNGAATLRAWTTGDGALALALRGLRANTGYPVTIRGGTCAGALVTSAGWVTATSRGTATRTLALSRSKVTAVRSAAARGRLVVRAGTGSLARCGTLSAVALYGASLAWRVERLPGIESDPPVSNAHGAVPSSIAATSTGLVVGGLHLQNDCTWEPVNRRWSCRPPTRQATAVWTSGDGISWSEQILGRDTGTGLAAAGPQRTVVVASGATWWSTDGRTWVPASRPPAIRTAGGWGGGLGSVIATSAGFVAVGSDLAAGAYPANTRAWISSDGDAWAAAAPDPDLAPLCIDDVIEGPSSLVAVGSDCNRHAAIALSRDGGLTWERPAVGSSLIGATKLGVVTHGSKGFVAYGQTGNGWIGAWTSSDGRTWRKASAVPSVPAMDYSWVSDAVSFGPGTVLVGGSAAAADDLSAGVLVSGDGVALRWAPWPPSGWDANMAAAVAWNGRLYVVGTGGTWFQDPVLPQVWIAELRPLP